jgi:hypothetical protein
MTGMKEGAGEDPFADDPDESAGETDSQREGARSGQAGDRSEAEAGMRIPYLYRRDGVKEGRDRVPLFLQPETKRAERDARREFEDRFDETVALTDLREALVLAGLDHLDDVEGQLAEWGYGMRFEE